MEPARPTLPDTLPPDEAADAPRPTLPDLTEEAPKAPSSKTPPLKAPRRPRRALLFTAIALLALAAAAAAAYRPLARRLILREAERLGFSLEFDDFELSRGSVRLLDARVELAGVRGLRADIDELTVALDGLAPTRVAADGVALAVEGSAADRLLALGAWSTDHPDFYRTPSEGRRIRLAWSARPGEAPWLTWTDGALTATGSAATFRTPSATVDGLAVGALSASWSADAAQIAISLGSEVAAEAPIRVNLNPAARPPTADVTLRPLKLEALGAPMGVGLPGKGAVVEGSAQLTLGERAGRDAIEGAVAMTIKGWVPPHPRQLDGIVYGNSTAFNAKLRVSEDRRKVTLTDATVTAGAFKLKGKGTIDRDAQDARAVLEFDGAIPCTAVARSAAMSDWGDAIGQLLGDVAQQAVEGSVNVHVHVEADTRDLRAAKLQHEVGVGCGLRMPKLF